MDHRSLNLLKPNATPTSDPTTSRRSRTALYFFIIIVVGVGLVYLIGRAGAVTWRGSGVTLRPQLNFFQTVKNFIFPTAASLQGEDNDRINILLLGIGGPGHDGPYLSDTNIIVSLKPSTREVALISIPRDLGVNIPRYGWRRINAANAIGEAKTPGQGGDFARHIFEDTFNISIPYYIRLDFTAFVELIDEVGGVTIDVPEKFTDTAFPGPNNSYVTISFERGLQTMDGERALTFARSRHGNNGEGSDFARARRQQLVLLALKQKLLSAGTYTNPLIIQKIFQSVSSHVVTNLSFGQIISLASLGHDVGTEAHKLVLDSSPHGFLVDTTGEQGAFILAPKTGNFLAINAAINSIFGGAPTSSVRVEAVSRSSSSPYSGIKIEVQNGTWRIGLGNRIRKKLEDVGLSVLTVGNSLKRPIATTTIYVLNSRVPNTLATTLVTQLHGVATTSLPDWLTEIYDDPKTPEQETGMKYNNESDIVIIVGENYKE